MVLAMRSLQPQFISNSDDEDKRSIDIRVDTEHNSSDGYEMGNEELKVDQFEAGQPNSNNMSNQIKTVQYPNDGRSRNNQAIV